MIGQVCIKNFLRDCIKNNNLGRFIIIRGQCGSGKREVVKYLSQLTTYPIVYFNTTVDDVRELITLSYQQTKPIIYCVANSEKMSANAQNALLKVCEEPPYNAYIILTVNDDSLLSTLYSRAQLLVMEPYSYGEKEEFAKTVLNLQSDFEEKLEIADTFGDLIDLQNCDFDSLSKYCDNIVNLINTANIGSVLKIGKKVQTKSEDDPTLFNLNLFISVLAYKYKIKCEKSNGNSAQFAKYFKCWKYVYDAKRQLSHTYNKQYIVDELILKLREVV